MKPAVREEHGVDRRENQGEAKRWPPTTTYIALARTHRRDGQKPIKMTNSARCSGCRALAGKTIQRGK
jgi:hypothetical protein